MKSQLFGEPACRVVPASGYEWERPPSRWSTPQENGAPLDKCVGSERCLVKEATSAVPEPPPCSGIRKRSRGQQSAGHAKAKLRLGRLGCRAAATQRRRRRHCVLQGSTGVPLALFLSAGRRGDEGSGRRAEAPPCKIYGGRRVVLPSL
ncbi:hypothetical protein MRX96_016568 [Rhipicephalus microplus]